MGIRAWIFLITVALAIAATEFLHFVPLKLGLVPTSTIVSILTSLLMISFFIERTIEVFVNIWREPQKDIIKKDAEKSRDTLTEYRGYTRNLSSFGGFALGLLISATGVRSLAYLIHPDAFMGLSMAQAVSFNIVDILLTGALLGGGSGGVHSLTSLMGAFLEATSKRMDSSR